MNNNFSIEDNILIAGASGLIGSAVLRHFKLNRYKNLFHPTKNELNYLNKDQFFEYCVKNKIKHLIFAAGKVGGILDNKNNQTSYLFDNTELALNALKVSIEADLKIVVLFGSSCMYPIKSPQPYKEKDLLTGKIEKTSMGYAISKILLTQGANVINETGRHYPFFISVIPNSTYGPNDNFDDKTSHVLGALINKIYTAKVNNDPEISLFGTGKSLREFVYSDDVADAIFFLITNLKEKPKTAINIGTSEEISIKNLALEIAKIVGYNGKINFNINKLDGAPRKILDITQMKTLGWSPKVYLKDGLVNTIDWYVNNIR